MLTQLDYVGRFKRTYLSQASWRTHQAVVLARADMMEQWVNEGHATAGEKRDLFKHRSQCLYAGIAASYLGWVQESWVLRNAACLHRINDQYSRFGALGPWSGAVATLTPWRFSGTLLAAEWLIGVQHTLPEQENTAHGWAWRGLRALQVHGIAGLLLEQAPARLGELLSDAHHVKLAAACYWAACASLAFLVPARLGVCALGLANATFWSCVGIVVVVGAVALTEILVVSLERLGLRQRAPDLLAGIDPHGSGRPRATQQALTRLRLTYRRQDERRMQADGAILAAELADFVRTQQAEGALPLRPPNHATWNKAIQKACSALQDPNNKLALPFEQDATVHMWHVAGFVWHLIKHGDLENDSDKRRAEHARWVQKISFVHNLVQCIDTCATRQAQHLLLPLQGFVGGFCIEDQGTRNLLGVAPFVRIHLSTFQDTSGAPIERGQAVLRGRDMLQEAKNCFTQRSEDLDYVTTELEQFLRLTYDDLSLGDLASA